MQNIKICNNVRHIKRVCENRYNIGRRQDYHEDKRTILEDFPEVHDKYMQYEEKYKILYVRVLKALYRMLVSSNLYLTT